MTRQRFLEIETDATGTELDTLSQGQDANSLHRHADGVWADLPAGINGWVATVGVDAPQYMVRSDGFIRFRGTYEGTASTANEFVTLPDERLVPHGAFVHLSYALTTIGGFSARTCSIAFAVGTEELFYGEHLAPRGNVLLLYLNQLQYQIDDVKGLLAS